MSKDELTKIKIDTSRVKEAIKTIQENGWDINPYTIAQELNLEKEDLYRDSETMAVILEARGNDCTFRDPTDEENKKIIDLEKTLEELEKENNNLATRIADMEESSAMIPPDEINNQVMELLKSESQEEIRQLQEELAQAYSQSDGKQEELLEQTRTVSGLEKVNEALNQRLRELEDEIKDLKTKSEDQENQKNSTQDSEEEVNRLEEIEELKRTVTGLEQVNDNISHRMRELEDENKTLKNAPAQAYDQSGIDKDEKIRELTITLSGLERVNEAINHRMRELEDSNKELLAKANASGKESGQDSASQTGGNQDEINQKIARLEKDNEQLMDAIKVEREKQTIISLKNKELEEKLAELHNEADALAAQLQNAWHIGYEKGINQAKIQDQSETGPRQPLDPNTANVVEMTEMKENSSQGPEAEEAGANPYTPPATPPAAKMDSQPEQPTNPDMATPGQTGSDQAVSGVKTHELTGDDRAVINFTQDGPYVSSDFNPLENLSWKDLETVYSMGVLSVKDFSPNIPIPQPGTEQVITLEEAEPPSNPEIDTSTNLDALQPGASPQEHLDGFSATDTAFVSFAGDASSPDAIKLQEEEIVIPDFDQMDIFEDIEELEELGKIEVPDDMLADVPVDEFVKEENVTGEELQQLIQQRIKKASEQTVEHTVRTPPAPGEEPLDAKGFSGINKFVGQNAKPNDPPPPSQPTMGVQNPALKTAPREIQKACAILGITTDDLTKEKVNKAWKEQIAAPGVHPDTGGDTEAAIILNSAKDELLRFVESNAPKLGKKFGPGGGGGGAKDMSSRFTGKKKQ